jgi:putative membrane protein
MRFLLIALGLVLSPLAAARAQTASPLSCSYEWMSWWGSFHMLIPLLLLVLVVVGGIVLIRKLWSDERRPRTSTSSRAHELLDERYAKGEIEREDYLRRRQDIRGS